MTLLRAVARPMLASMFISGGVMALRKPGAIAHKVQPVADVLRKVAPQFPDVTFVEVAGGAHDLALSAPDVREGYLQAVRRFLTDRLPG